MLPAGSLVAVEPASNIVGALYHKL